MEIILITLIYLATISALLFIGDIGFRVAEILGFGYWNKLSYKLDNLYQELETGNAINVRKFLNEN